MYSIEDFKNKTWYHQRFDGCPLFLSIIGEAETMPDELRPAGTEAKHRICFYEEGKADWFLDCADIERGTKIILDLTKNNPHWSEEIIEKYKETENNFQDFLDNFSEHTLSEKTDVELLTIFENFHTISVGRFKSSPIIDHFALGSDTIISDQIRKEAGPFSSEGEFSNVFSVLTAPSNQSFINEAEISLLDVTEIAQINGLDNEKTIKALREHLKKFFWIKNNFINGEKATEMEFKNELGIVLHSNINVMDAKKKLTNTPQENKKLKQELLAKLNLSENLKKMLIVSENFTRWQDERKKACFLAAYLGTCLIKEMGRRKYVPANSLKYLIPSEIEDWFSTEKEILPSIEDRKKFCTVIHTADNYRVLVGDEAKELQNIVDPKDLSETPNDIRGLVANPGLVRGPARIILSATDINLVEPGDILVAVMTRPDYVPGMKKAAAVVTDEGGITSHAAIVSRELGVPCIIGTKIATRVFKNGDLLEVNANHGVVKKLS